MKTIIQLLFFATISFSMSSCGGMFYQVYKITPDKDLKTLDDELVFENEDCSIYYNLWEEGGNMAFEFYNKTDKDIYLDLGKSFFIVNGMAFDYYQNRIFESSKHLGFAKAYQTYRPLDLSNIQSRSSSFSVSRFEQKVICIPSKTSKFVSEYFINETILRDCDLLLYPSRFQVKSKSFSYENSPLKFSNRISYTLMKEGENKMVENDFYVSEMSNHPMIDIFESTKEEFCGKKSATFKRRMKNIAPDKFYIKYMRKHSQWRN